MIRTLAIAALAMSLAACGDSSPGPLTGTWQAGGILPHEDNLSLGGDGDDGHH